MLDNATISSLHLAQALRRVVGCWPGRWVVPLEVRAEAEAWPLEGARVVAALDDLCARGLAVQTSIDPRVEGRLFAQLSRSLGQGESAAITIAYYRQFGVVLDDVAARRACERLTPPVSWIATEGVLELLISEGHLPRDEALAIWRATGISDPRRQIL